MLLYLTVPGAPQAFTIDDIQAQRVTLSWQRPSSPNGIITGYQLSYSNTTYNESIPLADDVLETTVEFLNEFTFYSFELRASTRIGFGPEVIMERVLTNQSGM